MFNNLNVLFLLRTSFMRLCMKFIETYFFMKFIYSNHIFMGVSNLTTIVVRIDASNLTTIVVWIDRSVKSYHTICFSDYLTLQMFWINYINRVAINKSINDIIWNSQITSKIEVEISCPKIAVFLYRPRGELNV